MHLRLRKSLFALIAAAGLGAPAWSSDDLRCGNKLVTDGDTQETVRAKCGEPADIAYKSILARPTYRRNGRLIRYGRQSVEKRVELWTYNFGPNKFMRRVRLVEGVVEDVETLGYGHR